MALVSCLEKPDHLLSCQKHNNFKLRWKEKKERKETNADWVPIQCHQAIGGIRHGNNAICKWYEQSITALKKKQERKRKKRTTTKYVAYP